MKITIDREAFLSAWKTVSAVCPARTPKPSLMNVKLDVRGDVRLQATDLEVSIRVDPDGVEVSEPGSVLLLAEKFGRILSSARSERLTLSTDGDTLTVTDGKSKFSLQTEDIDAFPAFGTFKPTFSTTLDGGELARIIRQTSFAADDQAQRFALGGCLVECEGLSLSTVGTDGRRLARSCSAVGETSGEIARPIIPKKSLGFVSRLLDEFGGECSLGVDGRTFRVEGARYSIEGRLAEGNYPAYQRIYPGSHASTATINVGRLRRAVVQSEIMMSEESRAVKFAFEGSTLSLTSQGPGGKAEIVEDGIEFDGTRFEAALDPRYVSEVLKAVDDAGSVSLRLVGPSAPIVCDFGNGFEYIVMPISKE